MKTQRNILIAFLLNLSFSIFEFIGGAMTGSVAILSDAVHDLGDATSIGLSYFLERKSKKKPDMDHTYGYVRYSVLGGLITTVILLVGSILVIYNAILRIINPVKVNFDGMIIFAIVGVIVNFIAAQVTKEGDSLNQRAVNLHMLEDVLGWAVVLIGAIIMKFTDIVIIDPILSILVSLFIFYNAYKNINEVMNLFLEKTPKDVDIKDLKSHLLEIDGIVDIHHVHVWSLDGEHHYATLHAVVSNDRDDIKALIREELQEHGISHVTIELERLGETCPEPVCDVDFDINLGHHHHH